MYTKDEFFPQVLQPHPALSSKEERESLICGRRSRVFQQRADGEI
jgi:hypothetical protein